MIKVKFTKQAIKRAKEDYYQDSEFVLKNEGKVVDATKIEVNNYWFDPEDLELVKENST